MVNFFCCGRVISNLFTLKQRATELLYVYLWLQLSMSNVPMSNRKSRSARSIDDRSSPHFGLRFGFILCLRCLVTLSLGPGILSEFCWEFISTKKSRVGIINQREIEKSGSESEALVARGVPGEKQNISRFSSSFLVVHGSLTN